MAGTLPSRKPKASEKHRGNILCRNGHHKWLVEKKTVIVSKQERLVTRLRRQYCSVVKTRLT